MGLVFGFEGVGMSSAASMAENLLTGGHRGKEGAEAGQGDLCKSEHVICKIPESGDASFHLSEHAGWGRS